MAIVITHLGLAVLLFYLINWIGKHSAEYGYLQLALFVRADQAPAFNFVLRTFTPTVFMILVATGCYALRLPRIVQGIWLTVAYYFTFRILYNLALGRTLLMNWLSLSVQTTVGTTVAYLAYRYLVLPRHPLFPDAQEVGNQLWIIIALFLYATLNSVRTSGEASARRKNSYVRSRFLRARELYGNLIDQQFPKHYVELVAYAVLIVESFNRPWIVQKMERVLFPWGSHTIGPMQVHADKRMSDRESVKTGVDLLRAYCQQTEQELAGKRTSRYEFIKLTVAKYNRDDNYIKEVLEVVHILWAQIAPEFREELERMYSVAP